MDAAICLPIFLIAAMLLLLLLMQAGTEETIVRSACAAGLACVEADAALQGVEAENVEPVLQGAFYTAKLALSLRGEWDDGPDVLVTRFQTGEKTYVTGTLQVDNLVRTNIVSSRKALFSLADTDGIRSVRGFVFRPWRGESQQDGDASEERVYVFPKYGERYHAYGCRIMKEGSVEEVLTEQLKRRAAPCKTCKPSSLTYGSIVFLFSDGSKVYHRKECASITKYYVSMPKSEATAEGYTPCLFCQGGS